MKTMEMSGLKPERISAVDDHSIQRPGSDQCVKWNLKPARAAGRMQCTRASIYDKIPIPTPGSKSIKYLLLGSDHVKSFVVLAITGFCRCKTGLRCSFWPCFLSDNFSIPTQKYIMSLKWPANVILLRVANYSDITARRRVSPLQGSSLGCSRPRAHARGYSLQLLLS
jgi:hypothetical protein